MNRSIWTAVLVTVAGMALGALMAGAGGAALGTIVGLALGLLLVTVSRSQPRLRGDIEPERVQRELLCVPRGRVAKCTLLRDKKTGTWLDVEKCSLEADAVECAKRCLVLMNDVAV